MKTLVICTILLFVSLFYIYPIGVEAIPSDQNTVLTKSWTLPLFNQDRGYAMTSSFSGNEIYFVDGNENKIGRLAPLSSTITLWDIPTANSFPTSVKFDPSTGSVYFVESNTNKIGGLLPFQSEFTEWKLNEKPNIIEVDSAGSIYYINENGTKLVRMD